MNGKSITNYPIHLGVGATAVAEPVMTDPMQWYEQYSARHLGDGIEGRLVSMHTFEQSWTSWEMHPYGSEVVICVAGSITLFQEVQAGKIESIVLHAGEYAINQPGVWHTADVDKTSTAIFITSGIGTQHRPR